DGIRDFHVTGVQTCALPISRLCRVTQTAQLATHHVGIGRWAQAVQLAGHPGQPAALPLFPRRQQALCLGFGPRLVLAVEVGAARSEERRVGTECDGRWYATA